MAHHAAAVRLKPSEWTVDDHIAAWSTDIWEVVCLDCGDDGGPFERQPLEVQLLRGPYLDKDQAREVATNHCRIANSTANAPEQLQKGDPRVGQECADCHQSFRADDHVWIGPSGFTEHVAHVGPPT